MIYTTRCVNSELKRSGRVDLDKYIQTSPCSRSQTIHERIRSECGGKFLNALIAILDAASSDEKGATVTPIKVEKIIEEEEEDEEEKDEKEEKGAAAPAPLKKLQRTLRPSQPVLADGEKRQLGDS